MKIKFKPCQRKRIRKFLSGLHGKERTDRYKVFTAIAYLVYTGCQWKMLPRYYPPPGTVLLFPQVERIDKARVFSAQSGGGRSPQDGAEATTYSRCHRQSEYPFGLRVVTKGGRRLQESEWHKTTDFGGHKRIPAFGRGYHG